MKDDGYPISINFAPILIIFVIIFFLLIPSIAITGEFRVSPIKLVFESGVKSGIINVVNEGEETLQVQMKAFEWTQDAEGKDQYAETNDLIFFPRMMTINKNEERILRAGIKAQPVAREKTYRLFIEEIPGPRKEQQGSQVQVAIRFGVPIFIKPLKEEVQGNIGGIEMKGEKLQFAIKNTGSSHFIIQSILIKGKDIKGVENFSKELSGWYLLTGVKRTYETSISKEVCQGMSKLEIEVKADQLSLSGKLDVDNKMCLP